MTENNFFWQNLMGRDAFLDTIEPAGGDWDVLDSLSGICPSLYPINGATYWMNLWFIAEWRVVLCLLWGLVLVAKKEQEGFWSTSDLTVWGPGFWWPAMRHKQQTPCWWLFWLWRYAAHNQVPPSGIKAPTDRSLPPKLSHRDKAEHRFTRSPETEKSSAEPTSWAGAAVFPAVVFFFCDFCPVE